MISGGSECDFQGVLAQLPGGCGEPAENHTPGLNVLWESPRDPPGAGVKSRSDPPYFEGAGTNITLCGLKTAGGSQRDLGPAPREPSEYHAPGGQSVISGSQSVI